MSVAARHIAKTRRPESKGKGLDVLKKNGEAVELSRNSVGAALRGRPSVLRLEFDEN